MPLRKGELGMSTLLRTAVAAALILLPLSAASAQTMTGGNLPGPPDDTVVAVVNGEKITAGEVKAAQKTLPQQYRDAPLAMLFQPLVNQLVDRKLVTAAAKASELEKDPEYRKALAQTLDRLMEQYYLLRVVDEKVPEDAVRKRFEERFQGKSGAEEVRARHILVQTEQEAREALAQVRGGADFAEVAKQRSGDGSAGQGGDLGFFQAEDMVPEFSKAAFAMQPGQVSEPVQSPFGWHVIKLEARRRAPPPAFEDVQGELHDEMAREAIQEAIKGLREKAQVQVYNIDGTPQIGPGTIQPAR